MEEHIIQTINRTKEYGELKAVDNVSLNIRKGEIFGSLVTVFCVVLFFGVLFFSIEARGYKNYG